GPKSMTLAESEAASTLALAVLAAKSTAPVPAERSPSQTPKQAEPPEPPEQVQGAEHAKGSKVVVVNGVPYTQLNTIGRGGSSKVYLVQNPQGSTFALKRVATESVKQLEAFQNEVVLLQQLRDRDNVIQVVDAEVDRERGRINIVMEAGDMDLGRFLQSQPRLTLSQIQHLWKQMLEAVQ
ncbi:mph1, partial [Symbiodinium necroappetens]